VSINSDVKLNPWHPITDPILLKTLGKLVEELGELQAALARCIIQGVNECEPETRKPNIQWLSEELADVRANIELVEELFELDMGFIVTRTLKKKVRLKEWHKMA
jgi:NTP pyrophosphatase (non-canonical NTP hydrolase)